MNKYKYALKTANDLKEKYDIEVSLMENDKSSGHVTILYKASEEVCILAADKYYDLYKKIRKWDYFADDIVQKCVIEDLQSGKKEYEVFYKGFDDFKEKLKNNVKKYQMEEALDEIGDLLPYYALYTLYQNGNYTYKKVWKKIIKAIKKELS